MLRILNINQPKNTKKKKHQVDDIFDSDDNFLSLSPCVKENEKLER